MRSSRLNGMFLISPPPSGYLVREFFLNRLANGSVTGQLTMYSNTGDAAWSVDGGVSPDETVHLNFAYDGDRSPGRGGAPLDFGFSGAFRDASSDPSGMLSGAFAGATVLAAQPPPSPVPRLMGPYTLTGLPSECQVEELMVTCLHGIVDASLQVRVGDDSVTYSSLGNYAFPNVTLVFSTYDGAFAFAFMGRIDALGTVTGALSGGFSGPAVLRPARAPRADVTRA
jgi:hypothetical protein